MRFIVLTLLLMVTLTTSAEEITTNNLLPNAGDGVDWGSSSTEMINDSGSGNVSNNSTCTLAPRHTPPGASKNFPKTCLNVLPSIPSPLIPSGD